MEALSGMFGIVVAGALLIAFWATVKRLGNTLDATLGVALSAVEITGEVATDSLKTYSSKVSLNNAQVRGEMAKAAKESKTAGELTTQAELDALLKGI